MIMVTAINLCSLIIIRIEINRSLDDLSSLLAGVGDIKDLTYLSEKQNLIEEFNNITRGNVTISNISVKEKAPNGFFDGVSVVQLGNEMVIEVNMTLTLHNLGTDYSFNTNFVRTRLSNKYAK